MIAGATGIPPVAANREPARLAEAHRLTAEPGTVKKQGILPRMPAPGLPFVPSAEDRGGVRGNLHRQVRPIGDEAVDPPIDQPVHIGWSVDGPGKHGQTKGMSFIDPRSGQGDVLRRPDRASFRRDNSRHRRRCDR